MRTWPLVAALLLLAAPSASAARTSVELSGPSSIVADGPAAATLDIALMLDGVVCTGVTEIPVDLRIVETRGVRSASLTWERVLFRIAGHQAATSPWTGTSEVGVRVWGRDPTGHVEVLAAYQLPPSCVGPGAQMSGEARHVLQVEGPAPVEDTAGERIPPPPVPKSESALSPAQKESALAAGAEMPSLPVPVLGAILGMFAGGAVVFAKRVRKASA